jgi:hypothetical protein
VSRSRDKTSPCRRVDCGHEACARTRQEQASRCSVCGELIGQDSYIAEPEDDQDFAPVVVTHLLCAAKKQLVTEKEHYP